MNKRIISRLVVEFSHSLINGYFNYSGIICSGTIFSIFNDNVSVSVMTCCHTVNNRLMFELSISRNIEHQGTKLEITTINFIFDNNGEGDNQVCVNMLRNMSDAERELVNDILDFYYGFDFDTTRDRIENELREQLRQESLERQAEQRRLYEESIERQRAAEEAAREEKMRKEAEKKKRLAEVREINMNTMCHLYDPNTGDYIRSGLMRVLIKELDANYDWLLKTVNHKRKYKGYRWVTDEPLKRDT